MPSALMLISLGIGFSLGLEFQGLSVAAMASLASLMTFSLVDVRFGGPRGVAKYIPVALALSFVLHTALLLLAAAITPQVLRQGWIIIAAVPPAVSVVPFTSMLRGDVRLAVASTAVLYVVSLGLTPAIALLLLDVTVNPWDLTLSVLILILLPILLSRPLNRSRIRRDRIEVLRNLSFAALTFFLGAANRRVIVGDPALALSALGGSAVVMLLAFGLTWTMLRGLEVERRIPLLLFSGFKNSGLAATLAIALLSPAAVVAPTMMILFQIVWIALVAKFLSRGTGQTSGELQI